MLLWAIELLLSPRRSVATRFQLPLVGLIAIVCLQVAPLGSVADLLSSTSAEWRQAMLPDTMEQLADGTSAEIPSLAARGRVSLYPAETLRRLNWLVLLALVFTRVQDLASAESLRRLSYVCLINGSILAYFSVIQHFTSETGKVFWTYQSLGTSFGPFVNRNHFAFYINICFGLSLGLVGSRQMGKLAFGIDGLVESLKDSVSLWMASVLVFMLGAVILCSSRGGMISLIGGLLITAAFVAATGTFRQGWKWFLLAAAVFAVAAGVQMWLGFDFVDSRYADHRDNRTELWAPLLQLVKEFPLIGSGLGTLPHVEPSTRPSAAVRDVYLEYAHNEYLQLAIEAGLLGLGCGCVFLWLLSTKIARRIRESRHNAWLYVGLLFSLSSICLHSFTEFGLAIPAIAFLAAVVFGHIAGVGRPKKPTADSILSQSLLRIAAIGILVFSVFAFRDAKQTDLAWRSWLEAQRAQKDGRYDDELMHSRNAVGYTPHDIEALLDVARLQLNETRLKAIAEEEESEISAPNAPGASDDLTSLLEAQRSLVAARELCPVSADAQFFLGRSAGTFREADEAVTYFHRSIQTRPADTTLSYIIGRAYLDDGDTEEATQYFQQSLMLTPRYLDPILTLAVEHLDVTSGVGDLVPNQDSKIIALAANWFADPERNIDGLYDQLVMNLRRMALETDELQRPNSALLFYTKGVLHAELGEVDPAISAYDAAVRLAPNQVRWRLELANLLGSVERFEEAHTQVRRVLSRKRNHSAAQRLAKELLQLESESKSERE